MAERIGFQIGQNAIRLLVDKPLKEVKAMLRQEISGRQIRWSVAYIPEKMPPREIPGVYFKPPVKQFRMPSFA